MRIGIDGYPLNKPESGIRRYTEGLLRAISSLDHENEYVIYRTAPSARGLVLGPNFHWDDRSYPLRRWIEHLTLGLRRGALDLLHGTNYFVPELDRHPSVLTVHDLSVRLYPDRHPWKRRIHHRLVPGLCRRALRLLCISESGRDDIVRELGIPRDKIDVTLLAADDRFVRVEASDRLAAVRERYRLPPEFALFLGPLEPRKNIARLVHALGVLARRGVRVPTVLAGSGGPAYLTTLVNAIEAAGLRLDEDVFLPGFIDDSDLPALYSLARCFVYPSIYEGFGLPPLEAMACGVPAILPRHSSLGEVFANAACFVNLAARESSIDSLESALERLMTDDAVHAAHRAAGLRLAKTCTWEAVGRGPLACDAKALGVDVVPVRAPDPETGMASETSAAVGIGAGSR